MAKWKGKKVTRKRLIDLTANAEYRRMCEKKEYGNDRYYGPFTIGGNKNSNVNRINNYY